MNVRRRMARRAAEEIDRGMIVNLGIGIPSLIPNFLKEMDSVFFHAENGILGIGKTPQAGEEDAHLCNAGGFPVTVREGGSFFDSAQAFSMIRRGKIDLTILGGLQVSGEGDLANWIVPGKRVPGMGGAIELASCAGRVIILMSHNDAAGNPKVVKECSFPLTAKACTDMIITDLAVFQIKDSSLELIQIFAPYTLEDVRNRTEANYTIHEKVSYIKESETWI